MDWLIPVGIGLVVGMIYKSIVPYLFGNKRKCTLTLTLQDDLAEDTRKVSWSGTAWVIMNGGQRAPNVHAISLEEGSAAEGGDAP